MECTDLSQPTGWNLLALIAQVCSSESPSANLCGILHQIQDVGASEVWSNPEGTRQSWHESHSVTHCLMESRFSFSVILLKRKIFGVQIGVSQWYSPVSCHQSLFPCCCYFETVRENGLQIYLCSLADTLALFFPGKIKSRDCFPGIFGLLFWFVLANPGAESNVSDRGLEQCLWQELCPAAVRTHTQSLTAELGLA